MNSEKLDNLLKKNFNLEFTNQLYSTQLELRNRKKDLKILTKSRFEDLISKTQFLKLKKDLKLGYNSIFKFITPYFDLQLSLHQEEISILYTKIYIKIELNQYSKEINYTDFYNMSYENFIELMLNLDGYKFYFQKPLSQQSLIIQESFI